MDLTLIFGGVVVSLIVQFAKNYFTTSRVGTLAVVVGLSLLGGAASWYLQYAGLLDSFLQILASSAAIYAFIVKNVEVAMGVK